ncbi:MAG: cupin domain-containing protein [Gemmatimonadaceae bacterium]|nr:cupin domain-containing protein [Gemmatimonadaceae bacterium]
MQQELSVPDRQLIMRRMARPTLRLVLTAVAGGCVAPAPAPPAPAATSSPTRVAISQPLPPLDGAHVRVTILEVRYAPGELSPPHSHSCPVIGYVTSGAIRTRTRGGAQAVYREREAFYEPPNGVHEISENASATEPATLLATFVCDHEGPLGKPIQPATAAGGTTR